MNAKVLVVEDEAAIRELIAVNLRRAGYQALPAADAASARRQIEAVLPDLVVLDWMLPDAPGIDLARTLRGDARTRALPIIMLTARAAEADRIAGFDAGADDYVTKPFSPHELVARVRALLRRCGAAGADPIEVAGLSLDPPTLRASAGELQIELSPTECRLLEFMMRHPGHVLSRATLLDGVWGDHVFIGERTVDVHVRRLRVALAAVGCAGLVQTVRGAGYRFAAR
ncbi:MAG: phosphate regulon transcriptional regulator PhoB [Burkholderiaceae bacterium]|nr:phosphate regulon transcriptional regulator PhoB [Burkholderiaceae bacterium]